MTKKVINDVVPPTKRKSIRDIPIPENRKNFKNKKNILENEINHSTKKHREEISFETTSPKPEKEKKEKIKIDPEFLDNPSRFYKSKKWIISFAILFIFLVVLIFSVRGTKVIIYPKEVVNTVNAQLQAKNVATGESGPFGFTTMEVVEETSKEVVATGEEKITQKASGIIIIYNEYTEEDQRLVKNTRFKSAEGFIYRISESIIVPGLTRDAKGNVVPGSLKVEVFADEAGEKYNVGKTDFVVPGFEGLPQYESFFARSESNMTGGFDGIKKIVSEEDRSLAETELKKEIEEKLMNSSKEQVGAGLLVFNDPSMQVYEVTEKDSDNGKVNINMKGIAQIIILDAKQLSNALASASIGSFDIDKESVLVKNIDQLAIDVSVDSYIDSPETASVSVSGQAQFVWQTDLDKLAKSLAGTEIKNLKHILENFPSISKVEVSKKAFWKKYFPKNSDKINLTIEEEKNSEI